MLELYHSGTSVCSAKVRLALTEKQLDFTSHVLDMSRGEHQTPDYRRLNPNAVVPTLVDDGLVVIESTVINEYLDERFEPHPLRPPDAAGRARMRLWTRQLDDGVHEMTSVLSFAIAFRHLLLAKSPEALAQHYAGIPDRARRARIRDAVENGVHAELTATALRRFERLVADMDAALARNAWLAGDELTLADIGLAPYLARLAQLRLEFLWQERPRVAAWIDAWRQRPAYTSALSNWLVGSPALALMAQSGESALPTLKSLLVQA